MKENRLPWVVEPKQLFNHLGHHHLRIVDLCKLETYVQGHVPGAHHLEYKDIVAAKPPAMGLLPDQEVLQAIASRLGLTADTHVVAYDDEGGGKAARLLWTLDCMGHQSLSLLNGGIHAWANEGYPLEQKVDSIEQTNYALKMTDEPIATREFIQTHIDDKQVALLDTRSNAEYTGMKKFALHGGHIPGAVNMDWLMLLDRDNNLKLRPVDELHDLLQTRGMTSDKTIVTYCQTNHRSALVYFVLKALQYPNIKAYPGSWSDWGNRHDTPIEV